jgi:hypothetical protein
MFPERLLALFVPNASLEEVRRRKVWIASDATVIIE